MGFTLCFDNVNWKTGKNYQYRDNLNNQMNMVQSFASRDRITSPNTSSNVPKPKEVQNISIQKMYPTSDDEMALKREMRVMIERILTEEIEVFAELSTHVEWNILHKYSNESITKTDTVSGTNPNYL